MVRLTPLGSNIIIDVNFDNVASVEQVKTVGGMVGSQIKFLSDGGKARPDVCVNQTCDEIRALLADAGGRQ